MSENTLETIDRGLCDQLERSWLRGHPLPIQDLIRDRDHSAATLEELVRIQLEYTWRAQARQGKNNFSEIPLVESYLSEFPQLNEPPRVIRLLRKEAQLAHDFGGMSSLRSIAERFPELADDNSLRSLIAPCGSDTVAADDTIVGIPSKRPPETDEFEQFGEYELLSKLGQGGMGVVYLARQKGANRLVALKVIKTNLSGKTEQGTSKLERFRIEAQVAASLDNDHIVPVYDVGQVDGQAYFAMRYIEGQNLKHLVAQKPLENREAARRLWEATQGIIEAHRRGILHRDLKPHNIMIDKRTDRAMVTDFGLAKVMADNKDVTKAGEVIGTPSYMAPEQIQSTTSADERSDVYSLGATLYHLLTGRPPFYAPHAMATIRQVLYKDPARPSELSSDIDKDLETICLKCLSKEPEKRYSSAAALAEDLQHYLNGEPIHARPISLTERTLKWCRRNPLPAGLIGLASVLAVAAFLAVMIGYESTSTALKESERHFALARETVDELYTEVSEIDLKNAPGMGPLKHKLLHRSLDYYQRMLEDRGNDSGLSQEWALNHYRAGMIAMEVADAGEASEHFQQAIDAQTKLLAKEPLNEEIKIALEDSWNGLGQARLRADDFEGADKAFQNAFGIGEALVTSSPDNTEFRRKLANVEMNRGILAAGLGSTDRAMQFYQSAQQRRQRLLEEDNTKGAENVMRDFAEGAYKIGVMAAGRQNVPEAVSTLNTAIDFFQRLVEKNPESLSDRQQLALAQFHLAEISRLNDDRDQASELYSQARSELRELTDQNPQVAEYRVNLADVLMGQAQMLVLQGQEIARTGSDGTDSFAHSENDFRRADELLKQAVDGLKFLRELDPRSSVYQYDLACALKLRGDIQMALGNDKAPPNRSVALLFFEEAVEAMQPLRPTFSEVPAYQELWNQIQASLQEIRKAGASHR